MVLMDHSSAQPGDARARAHAFIALDFRTIPRLCSARTKNRDLSSGIEDVKVWPWAPRRSRGDGGGAGRGDKNAEALKRGNWWPYR